jgi:hypothetical protein
MEQNTSVKADGNHGGEIFFRNVALFSTYYVALYPIVSSEVSGIDYGFEDPWVEVQFQTRELFFLFSHMSRQALEPT